MEQCFPVVVLPSPALSEEGPKNLNQSDVFLILYSLDSGGGEGGPGGDFVSAPLLAEACFLAGLKEVVHEIFSGGGAP